MKEQLKQMKETLASCVSSQMANLSEVDTKELGEAIDMLKDLEEALYYCAITEAMEKGEDKNINYYDTRYPYYDDYKTRRGYPMIYYFDGNGNSSSRDKERADSRYYREREYPMDWRDYREGKSPMSRRMYMESKELHKDSTEKIKELDTYTKELAEDLVEMIKDASPEERTFLNNKLMKMSEKISNLQSNG